MCAQVFSKDLFLYVLELLRSNMLVSTSKLFLWLLFIDVISCANIGNTRQEIKLSEDGGYTGLLVAIDDRVTENLEIIAKIQVTVKNLFGFVK